MLAAVRGGVRPVLARRPVLAHRVLAHTWRRLATAAAPPPRVEDEEKAASGSGRPAGPAPPGGTGPGSEMSILRSMGAHMWPKDAPALRARVAGALALLVGAKLLNVQVPLLFKHAVDLLGVSPPSTPPPPVAVDALGSVVVVDAVDAVVDVDATLALMAGAGTVLVGYGAARVGASLCNELRNAVFARVAQRSIRAVARRTFRHLHSMDLTFHTGRRTGGLARAIDRGTRGIQFVLTALVFNIAPIALEVALVCGLLAHHCGPRFAGVTLAGVAAYTVYTVAITSWRTQFRKDMNAADNQAGALVIDSLINYETVKRFYVRANPCVSCALSRSRRSSTLVMRSLRPAGTTRPCSYTKRHPLARPTALRCSTSGRPRR